MPAVKKQGPVSSLTATKSIKNMQHQNQQKEAHCQK